MGDDPAGARGPLLFGVYETDELWGPSGQMFVGAYAVALFAALIVSVILRRWYWRVPVPLPHAPLSLDELAFLFGGVNLLVDTAIARLVDNGALRVQRDGTLHPTGASGTTDLETDLIEYVQRDPCTAGWLRQVLRQHPAVDRAKGSLRKRRLTHEETTGQYCMVLLPPLIVLVVGALQFANGLGEDGTDSVLLVLLILTLVVVARRMRIDSKYKRTKQGAQLIKRIRQLGPAEASRTLPVVALTGADGLVLIGGLQAFPDADIAVALGQSAVPSAYGSSTSCGSSRG